MKTMHSAAVALGDRGRVEDFLIREVRLLDERRFEEWRDLFDEDGYYWVPLRPDQTDPDSEASLFYDDRPMMATRFERLRHPRIHAQTPPHRTCHLIGNVTIDAVDGERSECLVSSSMIMADYRVGVKRVFAGRVRHRLRWDGERFRIAWKRVDLIDCDDVFELIAVPF
ncbi:MAG TPA: aromatic-ring-hydroxylating dioxygenase subunit beta [Stellaceae bacterium]|nr:aromatic-ring-hydroxylating dioxygenase subunit beta [Stellaceae bacterium]